MPPPPFITPLGNLSPFSVSLSLSPFCPHSPLTLCSHPVVCSACTFSLTHSPSFPSSSFLSIVPPPPPIYSLRSSLSASSLCFYFHLNASFNTGPSLFQSSRSVTSTLLRSRPPVLATPAPLKLETFGKRCSPSSSLKNPGLCCSMDWQKNKRCLETMTQSPRRPAVKAKHWKHSFHLDVSPRKEIPARTYRRRSRSYVFCH